MSDLLADIHIAVGTLFEPKRLSAPARKALQDAQGAGKRILLSAISLVEVTYLTEKRKLAQQVLSGLWAVISDPARPFDLLPVSGDVARVLDQIPRGSVPDMPDRIIAVTALAHGLALVSADNKVQSLAVPGLTVIG